MSGITSENAFETAIVQSLVESGGYTQGKADGYSPELGMFKAEVLRFLRETQPIQWEKLGAIHGDDLENRIIQRLYKEMDLRGSLDVVRNGFVDYGVRFKCAFFKPESGLNPDTMALYRQNRLRVIRQVYYSKKNKNSVDLVLSLNGLPVATIELKNRFSGQNAAHAKKQYAATRDNRELLFGFKKKRALVHFAVDDEAVYMATRIDGSRTYWLPFNKGRDFGPGNPANPDGYRTDYLWRDILSKDSWLEIIGRFIHLETEEYEFEGRIRRKEKLIFPRFHQLDAVRKLTAHAKGAGAGHNYLVQHSAGSGKSNTIAWLSYRLSGLHNDRDERIFDSVVVVTDRRVLDSQLQNTIYQFEHKSGVVQRIYKDSQQLADAIGRNANIIITTLQKFPFVIDKVGNLPGRKYAVIIDEAHSSQGGEASKKMKEVLSSSEISKHEAEPLSVKEPFPKYGEGDEEVVDAQELINHYVEQSAAARGRQSNLSFFAFTATPNYKNTGCVRTHRRSRQAQPVSPLLHAAGHRRGFYSRCIAELHDLSALLQTFQSHRREDPEINKKKAARAIGRFVRLHPHNLAQKTEVIVEHFRQVVAAKIGGRAKAMLVTSSRLLCQTLFRGIQTLHQGERLRGGNKDTGGLFRQGGGTIIFPMALRNPN